MDSLKDGKKVLEPTAIESPGEWKGRFDPDGEDMRSTYAPLNYMHVFIPMPNFFMRSLGYTRRPEDCEHLRKKFTDSAMRWRCADCGIDL